jgi:ketosteroid isomerase-like protein
MTLARSESPADPPDLHARAQRLEDAHAIRKLLMRLVQLSDQRRFEDYVALFADDATFEITGVSRERGIAEIRAGTRARWDATPGGIGRHLLVNPIVEVAGDTARARSYIVIVGRGDAGPRVSSTGVYEDLLVRDATGWKLSAHVIRPDIYRYRGRPHRGPQRIDMRM